MPVVRFVRYPHAHARFGQLGMASSKMLRAINPPTATQATLDRRLKPFGLRLSLAPIRGKVRQTAA